MNFNTNQSQSGSILQGFFDELTKQGGITADIIDTLKARNTDAYKQVKDYALAVGKKEVADTKVTKAVQNAERVHSQTDVAAKAVQDHATKTIAEKAPKKKNYTLAATALGLGGLGFGYHEYRKKTDDQISGSNYSPVSAG